MRKEEIRELASNDLLERLGEQQQQLDSLKLNHAVSPLENPHQITVARRVVARIKTELRRRELEEQAKGE